ncbi:hypothetical protein TNCV_1293931 [Trichonephila clavipes]|nr:hypothetical protein TNCV_1293931 [Trichonephila clavipes]
MSVIAAISSRQTIVNKYLQNNKGVNWNGLTVDDFVVVACVFGPVVEANIKVLSICVCFPCGPNGFSPVLMFLLSGLLSPVGDIALSGGMPRGLAIAPSTSHIQGVSAKMLQTSRRGRGQQDDSKYIGNAGSEMLS